MNSSQRVSLTCESSELINIILDNVSAHRNPNESKWKDTYGVPWQYRHFPVYSQLSPAVLSPFSFAQTPHEIHTDKQTQAAPLGVADWSWLRSGLEHWLGQLQQAS
jgi:hypothetical protein